MSDSQLSPSDLTALLVVILVPVGILIVTSIAVVVLNRSYREAKNKRIFGIVFAMFDTATYIAFLVSLGLNITTFETYFVASLVFFSLFLAISALVTFRIVAQRFREELHDASVVPSPSKQKSWYEKHTTTFWTVAVLSTLHPSFWSLLNSKLFEADCFSATVQDAEALKFVVNFSRIVRILLKDIPQFVIKILTIVQTSVSLETETVAILAAIGTFFSMSSYVIAIVKYFVVRHADRIALVDLDTIRTQRQAHPERTSFMLARGDRVARRSRALRQWHFVAPTATTTVSLALQLATLCYFHILSGKVESARRLEVEVFELCATVENSQRESVRRSLLHILSSTYALSAKLDLSQINTEIDIIWSKLLNATYIYTLRPNATIENNRPAEGMHVSLTLAHRFKDVVDSFDSVTNDDLVKNENVNEVFRSILGDQLTEIEPRFNDLIKRSFILTIAADLFLSDFERVCERLELGAKMPQEFDARAVTGSGRGLRESEAAQLSHIRIADPLIELVIKQLTVVERAFPLLQQLRQFQHGILMCTKALDAAQRRRRLRNVIHFSPHQHELSVLNLSTRNVRGHRQAFRALMDDQPPIQSQEQMSKVYADI